MGQTEEVRPSPRRRSPDLPPLPPPIQPCSGFLGNGKSVIRPIAFKPLGGRLSAGGERYGSTPVLASRPPSHMTLYGSSSDVREARWCGSPQPASLSALPPASLSTPLHQRHHSAIVMKSNSVVSGDKEPAPAPSPADSGVAELERDHHDYGTTDRLRSHEVRVRAPRGLMLQSYAPRSRDERDNELARVRRDRALLRQRLEDTEWSLCQRAGEIALLKTQLKDAQNEQTAKGHEYLTLKADCRQLREALDKKEKEIMRLRAESEEKEKTANRLQAEVDRLTNDLMESVSDLTKTKESSKNEIERLKTELKELRQELSDVSLSGYEGIECGRTMRGIYDVCKNNEYHWNSNDSALEDAEVQRLNGEMPDPCGSPCPASVSLDRLKCEMEAKEAQFNNERRKWSEEKDKVLRYQKQLQLNYVQMFKRSRTLEAEVDGLRLELELCNKNMKNINKHGKTIEL
ncbi:leucine zipper putative tumor suppressor 2 homolog [Ostrinia nubilalis]|uniref:leucine zipper putative tumor suppressor 2 homolog isoform X1 n=1 Tax=Ostrinia furnacalis TaxID=93504 RepID=UPI00103B4E4A|nr:leucine zipper putative tumor suppressor 2 homolog isoform X1 [Ostrinia furnacalis]XP_028179517.1 leucine zipper putative tumor suppressor 2 homolog isoform X2 [Ostrinia furnacalis]XP_028179519.1 leucine zipper putative tumor suppressor 2 homolog isoform X3 [Ostrinia furnacalis]